VPATVLFLECKSYVIVGIYTSISEFPLMCGDVRFSGTPVITTWDPIGSHLPNLSKLETSAQASQAELRGQGMQFSHMLLDLLLCSPMR